MIALGRGVLAVLAASVALGFARPSVASERGYDLWFAGVVVAVDVRHGRLRIARGPIETAGRRVEECIVAGANLDVIRPGMLVEAQADTRRRPWRVLHLRVMQRLRVPAPHLAPPIALMEMRSDEIART